MIHYTWFSAKSPSWRQVPNVQLEIVCIIIVCVFSQTTLIPIRITGPVIIIKEFHITKGRADYL